MPSSRSMSRRLPRERRKLSSSASCSRVRRPKRPTVNSPSSVVPQARQWRRVTVSSLEQTGHVEMTSWGMRFLSCVVRLSHAMFLFVNMQLRLSRIRPYVGLAERRRFGRGERGVSVQPPRKPGGATVRPVSGTGRGAADLLRAVGLLADGPVRWGAPVQSRKPGVYVVELSAARPEAPLELTRVGKWLERLPGLRMDGTRPTSKTLAARLASFWWPDAPVIFAGGTERSLGGRVAALYAQVPGDRQPHPEGQWLHLLRGLEGLGARLWWAETDAPEEYLDALFDAFGEDAAAPAGRPA